MTEHTGSVSSGRYAGVIIDISHRRLDRIFTYRIPEEYIGRLLPGAMVKVPFGQGDTPRNGYVVSLSDEAPIEADKIKEILSVVSMQAMGDGIGIALAGWICSRYGSTMLSALKIVFPDLGKRRPVVREEIELAVNRTEAEALLSEYTRRHNTARARLLSALLELERQPRSLLTGKLGISSSVIKSLSEQGVIRITGSEELRDPVHVDREEYSAFYSSGAELSDEQKEAVRLVSEDAVNRKHSVSLLFGITGSGKTEVYISAIQEVVKAGRQAIVLIPEIALTYQTLLRFYRHFRNRVSVIHSMLSPAERADQFERARRGEIDVMIGPRSALFTPFRDPGIIVIDEEHEGSYKNEAMPRYHARETAEELARLHDAALLLGSATPSVETYDKCMKGEYRLFRLTRRLTGQDLPDVHITDLRRELREGNRSVFSRGLASAIQERLDRGEQCMLFLNRRGSLGAMTCRSCGSVFKCPHCDVSLVLHRDGRLHCHYCGYSSPSPKACPECGSPYIAGFKAGTEQVEKAVKEIFPAARTLRMDGDTTRKKDSYDRILQSFSQHEADILIGTQMIVKGHDFPGVTLVGILLADLSLYASDYRASERTFQLLTQAAGRAGRRQMPGEVFIQTYKPEHYAVRYAAGQDYESFYEEEMKYRSLLGYPPSSHMLSIQIQASSEDEGEALADRIFSDVSSAADPEDSILGPSKAAIGRLRDLYRYVVYIKSRDYDRLEKYRLVSEKAFKDIPPAAGELYLQFDLDPVQGF
ncbi:MAG: primosomal protein N' [Lachnospiraceae bacterium]|nr:primosomal protein N' [Lachnospiraceae bacterium]